MSKKFIEQKLYVLMYACPFWYIFKPGNTIKLRQAQVDMDKVKNDIYAYI